MKAIIKKIKALTEDARIKRVRALLEGKEESKVSIGHVDEKEGRFGVYVEKGHSLTLNEDCYTFIWRNPKDKTLVEGVDALLDESFSVKDLREYLKVEYRASCGKIYLSPDKFSEGFRNSLNLSKGDIKKLSEEYRKYLSLLDAKKL